MGVLAPEVRAADRSLIGSRTQPAGQGAQVVPCPVFSPWKGSTMFGPTDELQFELTLGEVQLERHGQVQHHPARRIAMRALLPVMVHGREFERTRVAALERAIAQAADKLGDELREYYGLPTKGAERKVQAHHAARARRDELGAFRG
ncbi:hypothetical protein SEA_SCHMIDT_50 [Gordonia phage Schmidt]|uniref:Uncharacterized protein n=1 Tax=Gordonia phage Schmidt TaxID=2301697 RepID=A0A385E2N6_9CAUD|nr:hypothetical protein KDJ59_gp50 [Gordonia phage Schmidt]AXQ65197.1 hypothetical protein SEA_SCHMIDT_50 [Gordonia phage Schmidt]